MDPAELDNYERALSSQATKINQNESSLRLVMEHLQQLGASVSQLGGQLAALQDQLVSSPGAAAHPPADDPPPSPAPQAREPYIPIPIRYSGDLGTCSQFLHQCQLVFSQQPHTYATPQAKIAFIMSLLTGQAAAWSLAISSQQHELVNDFHRFTEEMRRVFDHPVKGRQATSQLLDLKQGSSSVSEYAVSFRILAAESGWNDSALQAIFFKGLAGELKDELAVREECNSFNSLVDLAIRLDNRMRERARERQRTRSRRLISGTQPSSPGSAPGLPDTTHYARELRPPPVDEPMQLGRARLTPAERQRRMRDKLCLYCGQGGHFVSCCPELLKDRAHQY